MFLKHGPTISDEIEKEIPCLKLGKSSGVFSVSTKILTILKTVVSKPLEIIHNASFTTRIVPEDFKLAKVINVFKSGLQTSVFVTIVQFPYYVFLIRFRKS